MSIRSAVFGLTLCAALAADAAVAAERAIDKQVVIAATLDEAWAAWTTREGIVSFFAPEAVIEPHVGDQMRFMALQPKRMLSFDWNAPPNLPVAREQRTFVVVRFEPLAARETRVSLHHTGWGDGGEWDQAYAYFDRAWGNVLANLKKRFDSGPVDWTEWLAQLRKWREQAEQKK